MHHISPLMNSIDQSNDYPHSHIVHHMPSNQIPSRPPHAPPRSHEQHHAESNGLMQLHQKESEDAEDLEDDNGNSGNSQPQQPVHPNQDDGGSSEHSGGEVEELEEASGDAAFGYEVDDVDGEHNYTEDEYEHDSEDSNGGSVGVRGVAKRDSYNPLKGLPDIFLGVMTNGQAAL
jgi:hypothetical protein